MAKIKDDHYQELDRACLLATMRLYTDDVKDIQDKLKKTHPRHKQEITELIDFFSQQNSTSLRSLVSNDLVSEWFNTQSEVLSGLIHPTILEEATSNRPSILGDQTRTPA